MLVQKISPFNSSATNIYTKYILCMILKVMLIFLHYFLPIKCSLGVFLWPKQNDKTFGKEYTENQSKTRGQYGKDLHSYSKLPRRTDISWDKSDPNSTEY